MPDRLLGIFFIGHPSDDYTDWLTQRLACAKMAVENLQIVDGRGVAVGSWVGIPCVARHLDDTDHGPLLLTFAPEDFEAAMKLPAANDYELAPPMATFADACRALDSNIALLTDEPLDDIAIGRYAAELEAAVADGPSAELYGRSFRALYLSNFDILLLEAERPLPERMHRLDLAGGAVFFPVGASPTGSAAH